MFDVELWNDDNDVDAAAVAVDCVYYRLDML